MDNLNYWQGSRIRLRAIEPSDAETFFRWNQDSERNRLLDFLWPPTSLSSQQAWIEEGAKRRPENDSFHWVIETLDNIAVGTISTHNCSPRDGTFSYGVDVACEQRGNGYAGQAIWMVLRYFFDELRYQKVTVHVHADNPASLQLHEKLGFQREGLLRRMAFTGGQFVDIAVYGLTVEEYRSHPAPR